MPDPGIAHEYAAGIDQQGVANMSLQHDLRRARPRQDGHRDVVAVVLPSRKGPVPDHRQLVAASAQGRGDREGRDALGGQGRKAAGSSAQERRILRVVGEAEPHRPSRAYVPVALSHAVQLLAHAVQLLAHALSRTYPRM